MKGYLLTYNQTALDILPRCWPRVLKTWQKLPSQRQVNLSTLSHTSRPLIKCYLIMTRQNYPIVPRFVLSNQWNVHYKPFQRTEILTFSLDFLLIVTYDAKLTYVHVERNIARRSIGTGNLVESSETKKRTQRTKHSLLKRHHYLTFCILWFIKCWLNR